jgi:4-amino-4-deoxy-L-arabinose transferase-like glycosyltransferase
MQPAAARTDRISALGTATWVYAGLAALLLLRAVALYFNQTDLFFDEAQYWHWGKELALGYYSKPPLIAWVIGATTVACGDSTFCIRLPAPVLHTLTAGVIFEIGRRFVSPAVGAWAAIGFATLPGVSLSAGIISTDVPLLLCWAVALLAYLELGRSRRWAAAVALGAAIGIGLNAKYAMAFFLVSMAVHLAASPSHRQILFGRQLWVAIGLAILLIIPNLAWNLGNGFATFAHTADNARWSGTLLSFGKGLEFIGGQFGVFGPVLFGALLVIAYRAARRELTDLEGLFLCFTLPVLLMMSTQAFISRAHANWAATAYVAGILLVMTVLTRSGASRWLWRSLVLHVVIAGALAIGPAYAGRFVLPAIGDPYQRMLGWKALVSEARDHLAAARRANAPFAAILADERAMTAELLYYLRDDPTPVVAWRDGPRPRDHFELTRPLNGSSQTPALLVSLRRDATHITRRFAEVELIAETKVPAGLGNPRTVRFFRLSGILHDKSPDRAR